MKKQILILMSVILLVGIITAGIELTTHSPTVDVDKKTNDELSRLGLNDIKKTPCIQIDEDYCEFKMKDGEYNLGSHRILLRYCADNFTTITPKEVISMDGTRSIKYDIQDNKNLIDSCENYYYYNSEELEEMMKIKIEKELDKFTNVSIERESRINNEKIGGGEVRTSIK